MPPGAVPTDTPPGARCTVVLAGGTLLALIPVPEMPPPMTFAFTGPPTDASGDIWRCGIDDEGLANETEAPGTDDEALVGARINCCAPAVVAGRDCGRDSELPTTVGDPRSRSPTRMTLLPGACAVIVPGIVLGIVPGIVLGIVRMPLGEAPTTWELRTVAPPSPAGIDPGGALMYWPPSTVAPPMPMGAA
mmetsp:Transcript_92684/g.145484  ORF Transcript_92684/g.145484 Transcript_92684/m.145484 type:complete len:191 (+) Transcript_92684:48-620(+)